MLIPRYLSGNVKNASLISECNSFYDNIERTLVGRVIPETIRGSTLPAFNLKILCESSTKRILDLSQGTIKLWESNLLMPALLLSRSILENAVMANYLCNRLPKKISAHNENAIKQLIDPWLRGMSGPNSNIRTPNLNRAIDEVDRKWRGLKNQYRILSEFVHPNAAGTAFFYGQLKKNPICYEVSDYLVSHYTQQLVCSLRYSLGIYDISIQRLQELIPFVAEIKIQIVQNR